MNGTAKPREASKDLLEEVRFWKSEAFDLKTENNNLRDDVRGKNEHIEHLEAKIERLNQSIAVLHGL